MDSNNNYDEETETLSPNKSGYCSRNELRTLFVSGLPHDVKAREFHLLFHEMEGYEGAMIKHPSLVRQNSPGGVSSSSASAQRPAGQFGLGPNGNIGIIGPNGQIQGPVAFLTFATRKDAEYVKEKFQGFTFDQETPNTTMKLEFAKSNTKSRNRSRDGQSSSSQNAALFNEQLVKTVPVSTIQQQFAAPVAIDPTGFIQGADLYGRNMCWPTMCWPMATYGHEGMNAYPESASFPVHDIQTLQPVLFPTDQYDRIGR